MRREHFKSSPLSFSFFYLCNFSLGYLQVVSIESSDLENSTVCLNCWPRIPTECPVLLRTRREFDFSRACALHWFHRRDSRRWNKRSTRWTWARKNLDAAPSLLSIQGCICAVEIAFVPLLQHTCTLNYPFEVDYWQRSQLILTFWWIPMGHLVRGRPRKASKEISEIFFFAPLHD